MAATKGLRRGYVGEERRTLGQGRQRSVEREVLPLVRELQHVRESAGLSQYRMSDILAVGKESPGNWERGEHSMPLNVAVQWAEACGYELCLRRKE